MPMVVRFAHQELRRRPAATLAGALTGALGGVGLLGSAGPRSMARIVLVAVAATLASAVDPRQRSEGELLVRQGCPRTVLRLAAWLAATTTVAIPAATVALVAAVSRSALTERTDEGIGWALLAPAVGAWITAGAVLPDQPVRSSSRQAVRTGARLVSGALLVAGGATLPGSASSGFDLDLTLPVGLAAVFAGFGLLVPAAIGALARAATRLPSSAVRVGAVGAVRNRRGLAVPVTLVAAVACMLTVQSVVGEGLGRREADRVAALRALGPATVAGSGRLALVKHPSASATEIAGKVPEAAVAEIRLMELGARPGRSVYGEVGPGSLALLADADATREVAVATPELLAALGLSAGLSRGTRAIVLDERYLRPDDTVLIFSFGSVGPHTAEDRRYSYPTFSAHPGQLTAGVPGVLLPPGALPAGAGAAGDQDHDGEAENRITDAVVRYPTRPIDGQLRSLASASGGQVLRGDRPIDVVSVHRTDALSTIWVRDRAGTARLLGALAVLALLAVVLAHIGLRLALRREDDLLALLGARRRTLTAVSATRHAVVGVVGTVLGGGVGLVATAAGLARYNANGRFDGPAPLGPIESTVPLPVLVGLVALPLLAAGVGGAVAAIRPAGPLIARTLGE